jgi:hypothetical protein
MMHKADRFSEAGIKPSHELIFKMGELIQEMAAAGVFLAGEGLQPSSKGVRLKFAQGKRTVTNGPLRGSNELVANFAVIQASSIDEAIEWASRYAKIVGDVEIDIGLVSEPWDIGLGTKPEGQITRYLIMHKADHNSEAGIPLSPEKVVEMRRLIEEMQTAGALLSAEWIQPSSKGVRLKFAGSKRIVIDGPFTESKELIGGYSMVQVKSTEEAIEWASRFAKLLGDSREAAEVELDIRPLDEAWDFASDTAHSSPEPAKRI